MSVQLDWLGRATAPFQPHSDTSLDAARAVQPRLNALQARVLERLKYCGIYGATDDELQASLNLNPSTQRPRRIELVEKGLARDSGNRRKTRSGRYAVVWCAP